jgi:putative sigma-54 modulation protein
MISIAIEKLLLLFFSYYRYIGNLSVNREVFHMGKRKMFEGEGYNLSIVSKNVTLTDAIEKHIREKITKIERFTNHILDISVIVDIQKVAKKVSIIMKFLHFKIRVQAQTEDLYSAIDLAADKLYKLIKKYKTKLQAHKVAEPPYAPMRVNMLNPVSDLDEINDQIAEENLKEEEALYQIHEVVDAQTMPLRLLTQDEAAMKFDLSGDDFMIYKGQEDQKIRVMFRRKDNKIGVVQVI